MAVLTTGNSYSTGDQATAATQNAQVNSAAFASGAVDDSTTQLSGGAIIVKDGGITPSKCSTGRPYWNTSSQLGVGNETPGGAAGDERVRVTGTDTDGYPLAWEDSAQTVVGGLYAKANEAGVGTVSNDNFCIKTNGTTQVTIDTSGNLGVGEASPDYKLDVNGTFGFTPGTSVTPADNGDVVIEATNNTTLTFKLKGTDGTVRSGTVTLS